MNFLLVCVIKKSGVFRKYEDCFIKVCDDKVILIDNFVEFIIVGEKLKLDKFLLFVIILVFKCYFRFLKIMYDIMLFLKILKIK